MPKTQHLRIGASSKNDIVINDNDIDLFHIELFSDIDGNVFITDLDTKSGTFINGKRLKGYTLLSIGDSLVLGDSYEFKWQQYQVVVDSKENRPSDNQKTVTNNQSSNSKEKPLPPSVLSSKINKQLLIIYSLILFVLFLMAILF